MAVPLHTLNVNGSILSYESDSTPPIGVCFLMDANRDILYTMIPGEKLAPANYALTIIMYWQGDDQYFWTFPEDNQVNGTGDSVTVSIGTGFPKASVWHGKIRTTYQLSLYLKLIDAKPKETKPEPSTEGY